MVRAQWLMMFVYFLGSVAWLCLSWVKWRAYKRCQQVAEQYMRALSLLAQKEELSREEVERVKREGERERE